MSNCPECGEKVAEIDVFCSYCGISLTPATPPAEEDALLPTIVAPTPVPPTPVPETPSIASPAIPEPDDKPIPPPIPSPFADPSFGSPFSAPPPPAEPEAVHVTGDAPVEAVAPEISAIENEVRLSEDSAPFTPVEAETEPGSVEISDESPAVREDAEPVWESVPEVAEPVIEQVPVSFDDSPSFESDLEPLSERAPVEAAADRTAGEVSEENVPAVGDESSLSDVPTPKVILDLASAADAEVSADEPILSEPAPFESEPEEMFGSAPVNTPVFDGIAAESAPAEFEQSADEPSIGEVFPVPVAAFEHEIEPSVPTIEEPLEAPVAADAVEATGPVAEDESNPAAAEASPAAEEPQSSGEVRPSTKPNMGFGDTDGRRAAKLKPLDEGTLLNNRYEIVRKIGGGGMGAVYLANDRNLGGILRAVKEMVQSYIELEQQEKAVSDFQREAMILTNLEHPAIPTIYDYFFDEKEGRFYLVMRYISGGDLAARLRANPEGRLDEKTVTEWGIQVADVLEYLHRQDPVIVYRDLKPANIMIDGNTGRLMLIDFGIARSINKEEKGVTAVGTMGYAPPELFSGNVEPRSDIYSLGSTMFHLLTGADPQSNPLLIFDFQKNPRPRQINPQLSDQIEQIIMRAVEYNADMRFTSALELKRTLEEHLINLQGGKVSFGVKAAPSAVGFSEQLVFCGFCGKQIVASDVFCAFCGSQQPIAQQSFHQAAVKAPVAAAPTARLYVVLTNDLESAGFTLEKDENLIGRRDPMSNIFPEVDLSKYDPQTKISRRHARIRREGANFMLEDLGSSNGTILISGGDSNRLLPHQPRMLTNGDRFRVGDTTLQFSIA